MQIGASFPTTEIGNDASVIRDFAQGVEEVGYRYITCIDHVIQGEKPVANDWRANYTLDYPFHEVMVLLGFLAGATKSIGFTSAILILPQRPTVLVAKQFAELDVLTGGRLRAGVGIGWNKLEFDALNETFEGRAERMEEQIEVMRDLWSKRTVTFEGKWHEIVDAGINPMPVQQPIPVWVGAFVPVAIRRAGRIADGWFLNPRDNPQEAKPLIECFHQAAAEAGRDPASLGMDATLLVGGKTDDQMRAEAQSWQELGATHLTVRTMNANFDSPSAHLDALVRAMELLSDLNE